MKKLRLLLPVFLFSLLSPHVTISQEPNFEWAKQMGGMGMEIGLSITSDAEGNIYTIGAFNDTADFDPGIGLSNLITNGVQDIFVQKLDENGNLLWVNHIGGNSADVGLSIATDIAENIYCIGHFSEVVDFDPDAGASILTSNGSLDIFIQKLDSNGELIWVKQIGGDGTDGAASIFVDDLGNILATGSFQNTVDFNPNVGTWELTSIGNSDIFVLKLDQNGNFLWVNQMGSMEEDRGFSLTTDVNGNIYSTGYFRGTTDFDPGINIAELTSNGNEDIFIQKTDVNGNLIWVKQIGGPSDDFGRSINTDSNGNVYVLGQFRDTVDFDPGIGIMEFISFGSSDLCIQKLNSDGELIWVNQIGSSLQEQGGSINIDQSNNVYFSGTFGDIVDFDPSINIQNLTSNGGWDAFIQKLDADGNLVWVEQIGGTGTDLSTACNIDVDGNVLVTGGFHDTVDFDPGINTWELSSDGQYDIFVQKLSQCLPDQFNTTIVENGFTLSAEVNGLEYQWINCDTQEPLDGESGQSFTATESGSYAVQITDGNCEYVSDCVTLVNVGVSDLQNTFNLTLYPNPTSDIIRIDDPLNRMFELNVLDALGRTILSNKSIAKEVDLSKFSPGIYIVRLEHEGEFGTYKIIKE